MLEKRDKKNDIERLRRRMNEKISPFTGYAVVVLRNSRLLSSAPNSVKGEVGEILSAAFILASEREIPFEPEEIDNIVKKSIGNAVKQRGRRYIRRVKTDEFGSEEPYAGLASSESPEEDYVVTDIRKFILSRDSTLEPTLDILTGHMYWPRHIAEELNISIKEATEIKKRLKEIITEYQTLSQLKQQGAGNDDASQNSDKVIKLVRAKIPRNPKEVK